MQKEFKEKCRISKIPPKLRGYLASKDVEPLALIGQVDYFFGVAGGFR
jgi:hypothetical protein